MNVEEQSDDTEDDEDDNGFDDEKAYTLAVIVNSSQAYDNVFEIWRSSCEQSRQYN